MTFSLRTLFVAMAFIGFGCFALANANAWWLSVIVTLGICTLAACVFEALASTGRRRAEMIGCVAVAVTYLILVFWPWLAMNVRPYLLTTQLVKFMESESAPIALSYRHRDGSGSRMEQTAAGASFFSNEISYFEATAHCLCGFMAGIVGAALGGYVDRKKRARLDS